MVTVPVKKKDSEKDSSPSPSPSSSPSPSPLSLKPMATFTWEELNRLKEMFIFFDTVIAPAHRKYKLDPKLTAYFQAKLTEIALSIMQNKSYLEAPRGISIESAISIIDEELPKILKESKEQGLSAENIKQTWDLIKKLITAIQGRGS